MHECMDESRFRRFAAPFRTPTKVCSGIQECGGSGPVISQTVAWASRASKIRLAPGISSGDGDV
jgi:hypothetical protein